MDLPIPSRSNIRRIFNLIPHITTCKSQDQDDRGGAPHNAGLDEWNEDGAQRVSGDADSDEGEGDEDEGPRVERSVKLERRGSKTGNPRVQRRGRQTTIVLDVSKACKVIFPSSLSVQIIIDDGKFVVPPRPGQWRVVHDRRRRGQTQLVVNGLAICKVQPGEEMLISLGFRKTCPAIGYLTV